MTKLTLGWLCCLLLTHCHWVILYAKESKKSAIDTIDVVVPAPKKLAPTAPAAPIIDVDKNSSK